MGIQILPCEVGVGGGTVGLGLAGDEETGGEQRSDASEQQAGVAEAHEVR